MEKFQNKCTIFLLLGKEFARDSCDNLTELSKPQVNYYV